MQTQTTNRIWRIFWTLACVAAIWVNVAVTLSIGAPTATPSGLRIDEPTSTKTYTLPDLSKEETDGELVLKVAGVVTDAGKNMSVLYNTSLEKIAISGGVHYEWLIVERHNAKELDARGKAHKKEDSRGFEASYTTVVSDFKPVPKKLPNGKWQVSFHSNLSQENLP